MATQSNPELQAKLEEIKSLPVMRLRTIKWRWIFAIWSLEVVLFTGFSVYCFVSKDVTPLFAIPFMASFGGWQLGCASERNDWHTGLNDLLATDDPSQVSSHSDAPKPHHHKEG